MAKILRNSRKNHKAQFPKLAFLLAKLALRHDYNKMDKDGIQIRVYK